MREIELTPNSILIYEDEYVERIKLDDIVRAKDRGKESFGPDIRYTLELTESVYRHVSEEVFDHWIDYCHERLQEQEEFIPTFEEAITKDDAVEHNP